MKLAIKDLHVCVETKENVENSKKERIEILKGINLELNTGEMHAIMGPNGTGKSTLASVIMGDPRYIVTEGSITLDGEDVLSMSVDERSRKGIFLAMQYPNEIQGITNSDFIKSALQARLDKDKHISLFKFIKEMEKSVSDLKMNPDLPHRYINEGFSGGEKKRNEILQMKMLKPSFAILDEIDSGLDVDALRIVGENVNQMRSENFCSLIITHYQRLLDYIDVDYVHIIVNGKIVMSGGKELIQKIDQNGYDWVKTELGIDIENANEFISRSVSLGTCALNTSNKDK